MGKGNRFIYQPHKRGRDGTLFISREMALKADIHYDKVGPVKHSI